MLKVSIFTPTHNPVHLLDIWTDLKDQPFYEWIIVANGEELKKQRDELGEHWISGLFPMSEDERVKVLWFDGPAYVGALKKFACDNCIGDVYLELDHDDILLEGAVEKVIAAFENNLEVGFVYSNCANFRGDFEKAERYGEGNGWRYRPFIYKGKELEETLSFKDTPASVSRIWFCPNHLRAWRADVYKEVGGHNPNMRVLDDQELISRTYIHSPFYHIDECLYLYRIGEKNTWLEHNKEIQDNVLPIHSRFIQDIAVSWSKRNSLKAIDLGGRFHNKEGIISVDLKDAEVNCDLNETWPFEDNSIGCIIANDIVEHLKNPIHFMKEAHRVLVDNGMLLISVPSTDGRGAFQDPTHISFWNENSFWYYTRATQARYIDTPVRFQEVYLTTYFPNQWYKDNNICYTLAHLCALKSNFRRPGLILI
jgi:predicted SAM-dependent methyltransferase